VSDQFPEQSGGSSGNSGEAPAGSYLSVRVPPALAAEIRPRVQSRPADLLDLLDRHLTSATASDVTLGRYLTLIRMARSFAVLGIIAACCIWATGIAVSLRAGVPPWAVGGLGVGGPTIASWIGLRTLRRSGRPGRRTAEDDPASAGADQAGGPGS
jgi:hypothetical protein